ncbi:SDR family oxidoreductase [Sinorhizobium meliloti]|uniref:SDR family oxidoreductase n=1 Tax=Rhizobium meliloti TaxID=382 RepID=UPI0034E8C109
MLPTMVAQQGGDVVALSSVSGHTAIHHEPVYSASKHAIRAFVHAVRRQVAQHTIRVCAMAQGIVLMKLTTKRTKDRYQKKSGLFEGLRAEDVSDAITFILSRPPARHHSAECCRWAPEAVDG